MGTITVVQEGAVGAPAELTYRLIADDEHHAKFLPEGITDFEVVEGASARARSTASRSPPEAAPA